MEEKQNMKLQQTNGFWIFSPWVFCPSWRRSVCSPRPRTTALKPNSTTTIWGSRPISSGHGQTRSANMRRTLRWFTTLEWWVSAHCWSYFAQFGIRKYLLPPPTGEVFSSVCLSISALVLPQEMGPFGSRN